MNNKIARNRSSSESSRILNILNTDASLAYDLKTLKEMLKDHYKPHTEDSNSTGWELCAVGRFESIFLDTKPYEFETKFVAVTPNDYNNDSFSELLAKVNARISIVNPPGMGPHRLAWYKPNLEDTTNEITLRGALFKAKLGVHIMNLDLVFYADSTDVERRCGFWGTTGTQSLDDIVNYLWTHNASKNLDMSNGSSYRYPPYNLQTPSDLRTRIKTDWNLNLSNVFQFYDDNVLLPKNTIIQIAITRGGRVPAPTSGLTGLCEDTIQIKDQSIVYGYWSNATFNRVTSPS